MKNLIKHYSFWCLAAMISISVFSCKKTELIQDFNPKRMFTPSGELQADAKETTVKLTWKPSLHTKEAPTYTVQISQNSSFEGEPDFTAESDTTGITLTEDDLQVRTEYYARVRTNSTAGIPESNWIYSEAFQIVGEQLFLPINQQLDIQDVSVTLRWKETPDISHIELRTLADELITVDLDEQEITDRKKKIESLQPQTQYTATLFAGKRNKGTVVFTTKKLLVFTSVITPADNLKDAIELAANNAIIGLEPGVYDVSSDAVVKIEKKNITLASVSWNPNNTTVLFKGFELRGTGAGIHFKNLTLDGQNLSGNYLIDLKGETSDGGDAAFTSIIIEGSIVQHVGRAMIRGSRGSGSGGHAIDYILIENTTLQDNDGDYALLEIQKLRANRIEFINSTINRVSNNILRYDSNIGAPAAEILFDHVTVNAFGNAGRRPLFDINTPANVTIKNSIIANSVWASDRYKTPAVHADLFRAGNGASVTIQNTNLYNLMNTAVPPAPLIIPAATQTNVLSENLPWTHDTATKDLVIPAGSPLQTASSDAGPIGDLRIKQ